jgi:uncharacterized protein
MHWSKYNFLFQSKKYGYLLYNALTNFFAELDAGTYHEIEQIRQAPESYDFTKAPALYLQLLRAKILVEPQEEATALNVLKLKRLRGNFTETHLDLTIVPTLACNFNCPYCYESHRRPVLMNAATEAKLIEFIRRFKAARSLFVTWYGGEPLLCLETLVRLTEQIQALPLRFQAQMITNGYLLSDAVIAQLDALKIKNLQLTLDGPEEAHNRRRPLVSGGPTYRVILQNLANLLASPWKGQVDIRVNVDGNNQAQYAALYHELRQKFPDSNLRIYPGIVSEAQVGNPEIHCQFTRDEETRFILDLYQIYGIDTLRFYPQNNFGCLATCRNGFVIGPEGEVYKCWYDVGNQQMVVGSIYEDRAWNTDLFANYLMGTNPFDDPLCQECFYLPVCDGGCAHFRLLNNYYNGHFNTCVNFKHTLPEFLEIYYELKQKRAQNANGTPDDV